MSLVGRVDAHGVPRDLDAYDYKTAARDAIHFPKLVDRFWQNLRRVVGYEVQYFATLEPSDASPRTCTRPCAARSPGASSR